MKHQQVYTNPVEQSAILRTAGHIRKAKCNKFTEL